MARPVLAFSAVSLTYFAAMGLFSPYAPLWFKELGFSTLAIGTIASLQSWTRVVVPYGWSWLGDHGGRRVQLLRIAAIGSFGAAVVLWGTSSYAAVAIVTTLLFAFNGGVIPLSEAALARHLATAQGIDAGRYGRVRVWGSIGFIVVVLTAGPVFEHLGIAAFPYVLALLYAALVIATHRLPSTPESAHVDGPVPPVLALLRDPAVAWFFASIFFTVLAHTSAYAFLSLYMDALGYGKTAVGLLWATAVVFEIVFFWTQGHWFERLSAHGWLEIASGVTVLRFVATALGASSVPVLAVAQASNALTFAAHHAACTSLLHRHFPGRLRGRGQALYSTLGYGIPGVIGGVGGGWLVGRFGFPAVYWAAVGAASLGMICAYRAAGVARLRTSP